MWYILKNFIKNVKKRRTFYLCQVRSQFEHCTIIWRPSSKTIMDKLESVQKRGLKWILNDAYISLGDNQMYYRVCKQLNILPLSVRFDSAASDRFNLFLQIFKVETWAFVSKQSG